MVSVFLCLVLTLSHSLTRLRPMSCHLISSHLISSHLIVSHLILSHLITPHLISSHYITSISLSIALTSQSHLHAQLETLPSLSDTDRDLIQTLAVKIFVKNSPSDPATLPDHYLKCLGDYVGSYCDVMWCTVLYCTVLCCAVLCCGAIPSIVWNCFTSRTSLFDVTHSIPCHPFHSVDMLWCRIAWHSPQG